MTGGTGVGTGVARFPDRQFPKVTSSVVVSTKTQNSLRFTAQTAGANPMIPGSPTIDTCVDMVITFSPRAIDLSGVVRGDDFPNA